MAHTEHQITRQLRYNIATAGSKLALPQQLRYKPLTVNLNFPVARLAHHISATAQTKQCTVLCTLRPLAEVRLTAPRTIGDRGLGVLDHLPYTLKIGTAAFANPGRITLACARIACWVVSIRGVSNVRKSISKYTTMNRLGPPDLQCFEKVEGATADDILIFFGIFSLVPVVRLAV